MQNMFPLTQMQIQIPYPDGYCTHFRGVSLFFAVVKSFDANTVLTVKNSINAPTEVLDLGDCLDIT